MSKWAEWTQDEYDLLGQLIKDGLTNKEIAEIIGRPFPAIAIKAHRIFGGNPNYRAKITKHAHIREDAMRYFLTHTAEETECKFKLTKSQFRSLMTVGYRIPEFKHLRKETRRHDAWNAYEIKFLLQHSGLRSREWIAKKLKRGGHLGIKDRLEMLGIASKSVNGLTLSQYREAFNKEPEFYLQTKAGPGRGKYSSTFYKIIPWVWLDQELKAKRLKTHKIFRKLIASMALFQEWVFDGDALNKMQRICK
ncbi:MAG: hypothetical protein ACXVB1_00200 [Pseudobdellovibrionaceae bacterium]